MMNGFARWMLAEAAGRLAASAHSLFYHRDECWISDLADNAVPSLKGAVMVFAPSAGEVMSVIPMLDMLKSSRQDIPVIVLAATRSGITAALNKDLPAARCALSARSSYRKLIEIIEPKGLVIVQVSYAPGLPIDLMAEIKSKQLPAVVVNGMLPERDIHRAGLWLYRGREWIYDTIQSFCMRSREDADRVIKLGAEPSRVIVTGDMKYDAALRCVDKERSDALAEELGLSASPLVVAGSTHSGEERILLEAFRNLRSRVSSAKMVIAPRSKNRAGEIKSLALGMGFAVGLRSDAARALDVDVIVVDSIGELSLLYGAAVVSFVGGTLVPVGGHNVLEPAAWGKPVLFGRHVEHTADAAELLVGEGGALMIDGVNDLSEKLIELMIKPELRSKMGEAAFRSVNSRMGASKACLEVIGEAMFRESSNLGGG